MIKMFLFCILLLSLTSCNEYINSLCPIQNRADVENLDQPLELKFQDDEFHTKVENILFKKIDTGIYLMSTKDENVVVKTCKIGNHFYGESNLPNGHKELSFILSGPHTISFSSVHFDTVKLAELSIPYEVEERESRIFKFKNIVAKTLFDEQPEKTKYLVVHNEGITLENIFQSVFVSPVHLVLQVKK